MTSGHGTSMAEALELLLYASVTVNGCVLLYFTNFVFIDKLFGCLLGRSSSQRLQVIHTTNREEVRRFYLDSLFQATLPFVGFYLLFTTDVLEKPFRGPTDRVTQIVFSVVLGFYLFRNFRELFTFGRTPHFKMTIVHHVIAVVALSVIIDSKENAIYGVIGTILEGGNVFIEVGKYLKKLQRRNTFFYKCNKFLGVIFTIVLRGVVPVVAIALSISTESPLSMGTVSVITFFAAGLFFGVVNFYIIESAAESAFRQWFCDFRSTQGPITPPNDRVWQHRRYSDLERSEMSVPYKVAQPNTYVVTAPSGTEQSSDLLNMPENATKENAPSDAADYVQVCATDPAAITSIRIADEQKNSYSNKLESKTTVCPNYGTCNLGNTGVNDPTQIDQSDYTIQVDSESKEEAKQHK